MDFQLNREQEAIKKLVSNFAKMEVEPIASEIDQEHRFPIETIDKMSQYGLLGIPFPEAVGGKGGDFLSYIIAIEELAKVCASTSVTCVAHTSLCCYPIYKYGTEQQKKEFLPELLEGTNLGAFALTESGAGTDISAQRLKAEDKGNYWLLNGTKVFITNGDYADVFVVVAMTDMEKRLKGMSVFLVKNTDDGFAIGKTEEKIGLCASSTVELVLQNCRIPKNRLLGTVGQGNKIARDVLDVGKIGIAAQAVGIAKSTLEQTVNYMKVRKQFGRKISQFQALQFEIADMATQIEAASLLVYKAADMHVKGKNIAKHAAMAKLFASETAVYVTNKAMQMHGGYGYTKDYCVERFMRDAKITEIYEGTSEVQKMVISTAIIGK